MTAVAPLTFEQCAVNDEEYAVDENNTKRRLDCGDEIEVDDSAPVKRDRESYFQVTPDASAEPHVTHGLNGDIHVEAPIEVMLESSLTEEQRENGGIDARLAAIRQHAASVAAPCYKVSGKHKGPLTLQEHIERSNEGATVRVATAMPHWVSDCMGACPEDYPCTSAACTNQRVRALVVRPKYLVNEEGRFMDMLKCHVCGEIYSRVHSHYADVQ